MNEDPPAHLAHLNIGLGAMRQCVKGTSPKALRHIQDLGKRVPQFSPPALILFFLVYNGSSIMFHLRPWIRAYAQSKAVFVLMLNYTQSRTWG